MSQTSSRKRSHIDICLNKDVGFRKSTLLEEVDLIHCALPELNLDDVDIGASIFDFSLEAPFLIGAMTGGTGDGSRFNMKLAQAAAKFHVGMCLGSIRPVLLDAACLPEFQVKKVSQDLPVFANIGANQLTSFSSSQILDICHQLADGLMIHLNAGMELIQPSGDTQFSGQLDAIASFMQQAGGYPVVIKETGMGLSLKDGQRLKEIGIRTVETAGAGGTSWVAVESERAIGQDKYLGQMLRDFGIPTAACISWMNRFDFEVIGSGGVYTPLDAARAIRLGAKVVAMARPYLKAYDENPDTGIERLMAQMIVGLKYVMVCVGARNLQQLAQVPCVIGNRLQKYLDLQ